MSSIDLYELKFLRTLSGSIYLLTHRDRLGFDPELDVLKKTYIFYFISTGNQMENIFNFSGTIK